MATESQLREVLEFVALSGCANRCPACLARIHAVLSDRAIVVQLSTAARARIALQRFWARATMMMLGP